MTVINQQATGIFRQAHQAQWKADTPIAIGGERDDVLRFSSFGIATYWLHIVRALALLKITMILLKFGGS
jgi:hypothetical protein